MPKVHTLKANKDYPNEGIKKGQTYYKWSLRPGGRGQGRTYRSATYPKPQQLTSSDFWISVYDISDSISAIELSKPDASEAPADWQARVIDDVRSQIEGICSDIESLRDETQGKLDNMPEGLQSGPNGELLQSRVDELESWAQELESAADNPPELEERDPDDEDDERDADEINDENEALLRDWLESEVQGCTYGGE